ncbi:metal ABC transporter solute-binding protein, Zn/Mn family [Brevibacterium sp. HMSC063G07]|uniref:metal ABC transporter solute-binding protein, Zn/Mn family n=1 Tax=Brevibacterium sp. HMSC063G07 TaxID=1739261 RepID=UPI0008A104DB|nr:zinc ABC transporter substrate-binding protein [Brevibacterium sp. HMSC063G07]OFL66284.1 ABC transporter substrate-binding protein [Brevibacterium sp. HMSC063G07]
MKSARIAAFTAAAGLVLAGCGAGEAQSEGSGDKLNVVTSTNVYADLAAQVAGDAADIEPIISDASKDPHDYEATSNDQLKLSKADVVIVNGGGYDAFMTTMLEAADKDPKVVNGVEVSELPGAEENFANEPHDHDHGEEGHDHDHGEEGHDHHDHDHDHGEEGHDHDHGDEGHDHHDHDHGHGEEGHDHDHGEEGHDHGAFNEHIWYSVSAMKNVVDSIEDTLSEEDPDNKAAYEENADKLQGELDGLMKKADEVKKAGKGKKSAATEPVALWLFEDLGLETTTPQKFLSAVEAGSDAAPVVLKQAQDQIKKKEVAVLGFNPQAVNEQAESLRKAADDAEVPVVELPETLNEGETYVDWMGSHIDDVDKALKG